MENNERKLCEEARDLFLLTLSMCLLVMEFRYGARLYSNLDNENSDVSFSKCSRELQAFHPCFR